MNINEIYSDNDRAIYEQELRDWLPDRILDAHIHVFPGDCFQDGYEFPEKNVYRKFGGQHTFEQCDQIAAAMLPQQQFSYLSFATPQDEISIDASARYTGENVDQETRFGLTLVSPKEPVEAVKKRILDYGLLGYKPYRNYVDWKTYDEVTIMDMLSPDQMALADELGLVVVFHIPRTQRLADPLNQQQMVELCNKYPNATIIWAHIGRAYYMENVIGFLDGIAQCPNAYVDTAMVNHAGVLAYTFEHFPRERILFGSDAPVAWLRGKSVEINNQYAYLMGEDYAIGSTIYDANHVVTFTSFFYEQLRGIKEAAGKVQLSRSEIEDILYNNAYKLLKDVSIRLGKLTK